MYCPPDLAEETRAYVDKEDMLFKRHNEAQQRSGQAKAPSGAGAEARPLATSTTETGLTAVVDASRRIVALKNRSDIHRLAVERAVALTQAEAGAFIATPGGEAANAQFVFQSHPQLFVGATLDPGIFRTTLVDRKPVCEVVTDEPNLTLSPVALAAVPAIGGGGVVGLIVVLRSAEEPFGNAEIEVLSLLAPATASAHLSAAPAGEKAELDDLTRLGNRRRLDRDFVDLSRDGQVGLAVIKVDYFSQFADDHGQDEAEDLLRQVALTIKAEIRPDDVAYRCGTDEFGVLLPTATKEESAWVAERVRQAVAAATIRGMASLPSGHVTVSIGVTAGDNDDPQELTERALAARQEAEEGGHNQVISDEAI